MSKKDKQYKLALMLYCLEDFDPPISPEQWQWYVDNFTPEMIDNALADEHSGDCTEQSGTCNRCLWKGYMAQAGWILEMIGGDDEKRRQM